MRLVADREPALVVLLPGGETRWLDAGERVSITGTPDITGAVRIDFLTAPAATK